MNGFNSPGRRVWLIATIVVGAAVGRAHGDAIPSYTVTDLGPTLGGPTKDESGSWVVRSADGSASYPWMPVDNSLADPRPLEKTLPPFTDAPPNEPNPEFAYSMLEGPAFLNQNGVFVTTHVVGVYGHIKSSGSNVFLAQKQSDGSLVPVNLPGRSPQWDPSLWTSNNNYSNGPQVAAPLALNNLNQILGVTTFFNSHNIYSIADLDKGTLVDLLQLVPAGWYIDFASALDDQGRILIHGGSRETQGMTHTLLLTPAGLSSAPVPVPEPTTLATLVFAVGGLAVSRRRGQTTTGTSPDVRY